MTAPRTEQQFDLLVQCSLPTLSLEANVYYELAYVDSYQQQPPAMARKESNRLIFPVQVDLS